MMYTMPKNLLSICVNFTLATQRTFPTAVPFSVQRLSAAEVALFACSCYAVIKEKNQHEKEHEHGQLCYRHGDPHTA